MKSIYATIAVLLFSTVVFGQTAAKKPTYMVILTDNTALKKVEKKETETVKPKPTARPDAVKSPSPVETVQSFTAEKSAQTADENPETNGNAANRKAKKVSDWEKTWSILAKFSTSFDTNIEHDPVGVPAFGFVASVSAGYQMRLRNHRLKFIYSFGAPRYTVETDLNRFDNYFAAAYRYSIGKWSFETEGEASLKGTSEDRETNDQYILTETVGYRFDSKTRVNLYGAYRVRRFPSEDADRNAVNPMLGFKFSRKLSRRFDWNFGYRYDENRAASARQNYIRTTYRTSFDAQITKNALPQIEFPYRPRRYSSRLVEVGEEEVLRCDKKWNFDAVWTHNFTRRRGFKAGYQYERQTSNAPDKIYRNHQIFISVFYHWGNGEVIAP